MVIKYKSIKPLIIGLGVAGRRHLEAQLNLGIKTGVYTINPQTAESLRGQNNVIVFDNLEKAIDWSNLVHVCTPDDKHTEFVAAAVKKRKVVLCEKSFTTSLKDALYLQKLAHQYESIVFVGHNYRLTPTFLETRKRILEGELGAIIKIETTYLHDKKNFQKRYLDKDFLYIGGSHAIDLAFWIANDQKIINIKATSKNKLSYQININFFSGIAADIRLDANSSRSISGADLIVHGEKGKLVSHNKKDNILLYEKGSKGSRSFKLSNTKTYTITKEVKIIDDYLLGRRSSYWPIPNIDEAINTIKILDAVKKYIYQNYTGKLELGSKNYSTIEWFK